MGAFVLIKYIHILAILGIVSSVVAEHLLIKDELTRREIGLLARLDAVYGISALVAVLAGLTMWFWIGKPAEYYSRNWIFHTKWLLFVMVAVLSIFPTVFFLKYRKGDPNERVKLPAHMVLIIRVELILLLLIPLFAVLMAQGFGAF
jgi:putative membrane protein